MSAERVLGASRRTSALVAVALVVLVFVAFGRAVGNDFVTYDDDTYITANPLVLGGVTARGVIEAFTTFHAANWHPVTWLSHMLDVELFGLDPGKHHLVGVALHALNAVLLFAAILMSTRRLWPAALVAALFAVHPLRVESVVWASERKDLLAGTFWLCTLLAWARYGRTGRRRPWVASIVFLFLGLLAKPMLVTLPFVLLLIDRWPLQRLRDVTALRLVLEKLPHFGLVVASCMVTSIAQERGGAISSLGSLPFVARLGNAALAVTSYVGATLWPQGLACIYPLDVPPPEGAGRGLGLAASLAIAFVVLSIVGAFVLRRRAPWFTTGWLWFIGSLVPVAGLVQVGSQSHADRYTYLPTIGLVLAGVFAADAWLRLRPEFVRPALFGAAGAVLALTFASVRQTATWRDSETLYRRALAVTDRNYVANHNLGNVFVLRGQPAEALPYFERALELHPNYYPALNGLGDALSRLERYAEAQAALEHCVRVRPDYAEGHNNLGLVHGKLGALDAAVREFRRAVELAPDHAVIHANLASAYALGGSFEAAVAHFEEALRLAPENRAIEASLARSRAGLAAARGGDG